MEFPHGLKLKCSSRRQIKSSKRKCMEEPEINILHLSDCTLLYVLQYLDATSLYQLGKTCTRFQRLVQDDSLWIHVDGRSQPNSVDKLEFCWMNIDKKTKHLLLSGGQRSDVVFLSEILVSGKLNNLTVLALEHQYIKYWRLNQLPSTVKELSFRHSYISHPIRFFKRSDSTMCNLKTLILDHCQWFIAHHFKHICHYNKLEILSLYMCKKLSEDDIKYISVFGQVGFKSLKVVDLRFTGIGELFIKYFFLKPTIQIIYFQCFASTYYVERYKRKLDIVNGMKMHEHSYVSDDEDNNDTNLNSLHRRFGGINWREYSTHTINDNSMTVVNYLKKTPEVKIRPKSLLYVYPYDECTCGFSQGASRTYVWGDSPRQDYSSDEDMDDEQSNMEDLHKAKNKKSTDDSSSTSVSDDEYTIWDPKLLHHKLCCEIRKQKRNRQNREGGKIHFLVPQDVHLCRKSVYDSCANPEWCQVQSTPKTCLRSWLYVREPRNDYEISMLEHTDKHSYTRFKHDCSLNPDCNCSNTEDEEVIYVRQNADGAITHSSSRTHTIPSDPGTCVHTGSIRFINGKIHYFINILSDCIERLKASQWSENKAIIVVHEILHTISDCFNETQFIQLLKDRVFVWHLCILLYWLSKTIKQEIHHVLDFHTACFTQLSKELSNSTDDTKCKHILERFFINLLCSEGGLLTFGEYFVEPEDIHTQPYNKIQYKVRWDLAEEIWNHTGSSTDSIILDKNKTDEDAALLKNIEERDRIEKNKKIKEISLSFKQCCALIRNPINLLQSIRMARPPTYLPTNIKELSLRGFPDITDETLVLLRVMDLDLLDVTGTNVTQMGVKQFMAYNPHCRLIHESACRCRPKLHF